MTKFVVIGLDMGAALKIGEALGYDRTGLAEFLSFLQVWHGVSNQRES